MIKKQGTTLEMITAWQDFYEQEQQRNEITQLQNIVLV